MFHTWFGWWYLTLMLYMVALLVYGVRAQTKSRMSWLERAGGRVLMFRKPRALRRVSLMVPGVFVLMLLPSLFAPHVSHRNTQGRNDQGVFARTLSKGFMTLSVLGLSAFFIFLAGPADFRLDGQRRVYEKTEGWPWRPKTRGGPLDDFQGVCITPQNSVMLVPRKPDRLRSGYLLSGAVSREAARALAGEITQTVGIPLIEYSLKR